METGGASIVTASWVYSDYDTLAWLFTIDGIFLIDQLNTYSNSGLAIEANDLIMLENQIPLIVLKEIRKALLGENAQAQDDYLEFKFRVLCESLSPFSLSNVITNFSQVNHLLDYMYHSIVNNETSILKKVESTKPISDPVEKDVKIELVETIMKVAILIPGAQPVLRIAEFIQQHLAESDKRVDEIKVPTVSQLWNISRVRFRLSPTNEGIRNIKFVNGKERVCYLPLITLNINSEVVLRNLVAYEKLMAGNIFESGYGLELTEYVDLLCGIIDNVKDVKLLREGKVIAGDLGDGAIVKMFNGLQRSRENVSVETESNKTLAQLNKVYESTPRVWCQKLVEKQLQAWSKIIKKLYKFKEGEFPDLHLNDIEDMILLIAQNMLFNLECDVIVGFVTALKMFTRGIIVKNKVEDVQLGVESYQRKLDLTKSQRTYPHISVKEPYTLNFDPPGVIYEDKRKKKRLTRVDEIHKFCDGTLQSIRNILRERLLNFKFGYNKGMPSREWIKKDKRRTCIMLNKIDDQLFKRRVLRSLEVLNRRDLPRDIPLDIIEVLSDVGNPSRANIKQDSRSDAYAENPVKEILLNLNLPDHRSVLIESKTSLWLKDGNRFRNFVKRIGFSSDMYELLDKLINPSLLFGGRKKYVVSGRTLGFESNFYVIMCHVQFSHICYQMASLNPSLSPSIGNKPWVDQISKTLQTQLAVTIDTPPVSIYEVPKIIKTENPEAYIPRRIGLGPNHHFQPELYKKMEQKKLTAMRRVLKLHQIHDYKQQVVEKVKQIIPAICACYDLYLDSDDETLAWVFAIDGIFLIDELNTYSKCGLAIEANDLVKLENQIPLIVLKEIHKALSGESAQTQDNHLEFKLRVFCESHSPIGISNVKTNFGQANHLLDYMYHSIVNNETVTLRKVEFTKLGSSDPVKKDIKL
nr:putative UPF0481 protein At3g02645 [Tanacetum cinerariifolium]